MGLLALAFAVSCGRRSIHPESDDSPITISGGSLTVKSNLVQGTGAKAVLEHRSQGRKAGAIDMNGWRYIPNAEWSFTIEPHKVDISGGGAQDSVVVESRSKPFNYKAGTGLWEHEIGDTCANVTFKVGGKPVPVPFDGPNKPCTIEIHYCSTSPCP